MGSGVQSAPMIEHQKCAARRQDFSLVARAATKSRLPFLTDSGHVDCIGQMIGIAAEGSRQQL
jgi:hypothetical protein